MNGRALVIGGGMAGLACARALRAGGVDVLLLEESERAGGAVRSDTQDGFLLEKGPNTVRPTSDLWSLVEELGLRERVVLSDPRLPRFVDFGGRLHALPNSPGALIGTRLLSARGKLRLLAEPFRPSPAAGDESVLEFFTRRLGPEVAERVVEPFVGGIFAGDASRLSLASAFPTLARWEREHGGILRGAIAGRDGPAASGGSRPPRGLLSFRNGLEELPRALARDLGTAYADRSPVERMSRRSGGFAATAAGREVEADRVILAVPAWRAAELVGDVSPAAASALAGIAHPPLAVLHLAWPEAERNPPLRGFGHLVVPSPDRRILGAVWTSRLFPGRAPEGWALLTVFLGGARDPDAAALSDEALARAAERDLEAEGLTRGPARVLAVTRWPRAIPQYERGHAERMRALDQAEREHPGLFFLGNYRGGISVGDVTASARAAARRAAAPLLRG